MSQSETVLETVIPAQTLKTTIDILYSIAEEAIFRIGKDGLSVAVIDPAGVCMHHLNVEPDAFTDTPSGQFPIGIDLEDLQDAIGKASGEEDISLSFKPETGMLHGEYGMYTFNLAAIDPDSIRQEPDISEINLRNKIDVETSKFRDAIQYAELVTDQVDLHCYPDDKQFVVVGEGDTDDNKIRFGPDDVEEGTSINEETKSKYSIGYLTDVLKVVPDDEIEIEVDDDHPIWMEYEYADGNADVTTMLAPRIKSQ